MWRDKFQFLTRFSRAGQGHGESKRAAQIRKTPKKTNRKPLTRFEETDQIERKSLPKRSLQWSLIFNKTKKVSDNLERGKRT